jgi:hypothetical protein
MTTTNTRYKSDMTVFLDNNFDIIAANLFKIFREFDTKKNRYSTCTRYQS